jgi:hypothetical protein
MEIKEGGFDWLAGRTAIVQTLLPALSGTLRLSPALLLSGEIPRLTPHIPSGFPFHRELGSSDPNSNR